MEAAHRDRFIQIPQTFKVFRESFILEVGIYQKI